MEKHGKLGEMHFGSRKNRRGENCIFILTIPIEIARQVGRGLIICFLEGTRAYYMIHRQRLPNIPEERGMPGPILGLPELQYTHNIVHDA